MLPATYKQMTEKLSLIDAAANKLCFIGEERSRLFYHFCQNDLRFEDFTFKLY